MWLYVNLQWDFKYYITGADIAGAKALNWLEPALLSEHIFEQECFLSDKLSNIKALIRPAVQKHTQIITPTRQVVLRCFPMAECGGNQPLVVKLHLQFKFSPCKCCCCHDVFFSTGGCHIGFGSWFTSDALPDTNWTWTCSLRIMRPQQWPPSYHSPVFTLQIKRNKQKNHFNLFQKYFSSRNLKNIDVFLHVVFSQ